MPAAIRAMQADDTAAIADLTLAAIRQTGLRAYMPAQVAAWAARYNPQRLLACAARGDLILVAVDACDHPLAYIVMEADGHCDMLYCHPDHGGQGLAAALLAQAERHACAAGLSRLYTEASELARPVFARAGFVVLHRRDFAIGPNTAPVTIHNYAMEKRLI